MNYEQFKKQAIKSEAFRKETSTAGLQLLSASEVSIEGSKPIQITDSAFGDLVQHFGLSKSAYSVFNKALGEEKAFHLVDMIRSKSARFGSKNDKLTAIVSPVNNNIIGFSKEAKSPLSADNFFKLFEDVMSNNKNMTISKMGIDHDGTAQITAANKDWGFRVPGLKDEDFNGGLGFKVNGKGTDVSFFNERLVCTNGMVREVEEEAFSLHSSSHVALTKFIKNMQGLKDVTFFQNQFIDRVKLMNNTQASVSEVQMALGFVRRMFDYTDKPALATHVDNNIPYSELVSAYTKVGVDINSLSKAQTNKIRSNMSMWELINGMTYIATHTNNLVEGLEIASADQLGLQRRAGGMSNREFDLALTVPQLY